MEELAYVTHHQLEVYQIKQTYEDK